MSGERSPLPTLTRKAQVLAVIKAGGKVRSGQRARLWVLLDKHGREVPAWQTAIKGAVSHLASNRGTRITATAATDGTRGGL
ncbi:MAG: hypothetical protein J0H50_11720 [Xanthomonadales bacterium]|nr:hypothetical protein [Xanthomonadales bacterium]